MGSTEGIGGERLEDVGLKETVYVAVGMSIEKSRQLLLWAVHNCFEKKICVLHVHRPERINYLTDRKLNEIEPEDNQIKAFQEQERQIVHELLDQYVLTLTLAGVEANKILIKMDSIEKGILHAIAEHNIKWLVMGASGDIYRSERFIFLRVNWQRVFEQASVSCNIWFIHKGNLIYTSADSKDISEIETAPSLLVLSSNTGGKQYEISSECTPSSQKYLDAEKMEGMLINFSSHCSVESVKSSTKLTDLLSLEVGSDAQDDTREQDGRRELANVDARSFRSNEVVGAVESSNIEDNSTVLVEASKSLCANEVSRRRELEELYAREKLELQKVKDQQDEIMGKLRMIQDQNSALDGQVVESKIVVAELEEKILSAVELLIRFKDRRDKLKIEHLNAVRELNKLRNFVNADAEYPHGTEFPTFSFLEINEATNDFDPSWKIGEGRYGSVYKGLLHNMQVAIRMLPSYGCQSLLEFQHQVEVLSRVRHRNLVTLIGSCPESRSLVYDYLNNGSLEDHLARKDKTPLPWQIRISIAADICSALIFIHSCEPCIIHGNLKPSKILLDVNFVAKLCDLGFSSLVQFSGHPADSNKTVDKRNENLVYADPEFLTTGKLTPESDVYSFGIILLQLLTGRPLSGIVRDTKCALEKENLKALLDISAGEWPLYQVEQLASLALRCSEKTQLNRPDLLSEIWSLLRPLQTSCSNMSPYSTSKKLQRPPSHFVCPIFQEVMKDPYIAADGFTYEEDAIRGWLDGGHNTSPMTNLKLEHTNLVPNYALLNAIQEWQHLQ
ncbi:hypothetical protein K1719_041681 [Acacia pycnantha]|nr:hypothetical protein K1719_041681 [Acacia pycnantha]